MFFLVYIIYQKKRKVKRKEEGFAFFGEKGKTVKYLKSNFMLFRCEILCVAQSDIFGFAECVKVDCVWCPLRHALRATSHGIVF